VTVGTLRELLAALCDDDEVCVSRNDGGGYDCFYIEHNVPVSIVARGGTRVLVIGETETSRDLDGHDPRGA
jgi:hypothetical protein